MLSNPAHMMTENDLVEKLREMREHGPPDLMTMLFGLIFHQEIGSSGPSIAKEYNGRGYAGPGTARLSRTGASWRPSRTRIGMSFGSGVTEVRNSDAPSRWSSVKFMALFGGRDVK